MLRILLSLAVALSVIAGTAYAKAPKNAPKPKKTIEDRFNDMDANKDGKVSLDEFKAKFPKPELAEKVFKKMDADGDGSLTLEEYKTAIEKQAQAHKAKKKSGGQ
jgi:Ca2+-binding EF-hand superfamily protein